MVNRLSNCRAFYRMAPRISTLLRCQANFFLSHVRLVRSCRKKSSFLALGHFFAVLLVAVFNEDTSYKTLRLSAE